MRWCKISPDSCRKLGGPCCKDCTDETCRLRCLNDPKRCECWGNKPRQKAAPRPRKRGRKLSVDQEEIVRLYKAGLLQREIAAQLGCDASWVSMVLKKKGVSARGKS